MIGEFKNHLAQQLDSIRGAGTFKQERVIMTPQGTTIRVADRKPVLNLCANNYLGLAQDPRVVAAAKAALDQWAGVGVYRPLDENSTDQSGLCASGCPAQQPCP